MSTLLVLVLCIVAVLGDNYTDKYPRLSQGYGVKREPRFITFNTGDTGDIEVQLEFAVPFIKIPVKKTVDNAWDLMSGQGLANINVGSLVIAGGMVIGAVVAVPFLSSLLMNNIFKSPTYRSNEGRGDEVWRLMTIIDNALIENNIDTTSCMQRTICWIAKSSRNKVHSGEATSQDKLIDGLASNEWVNSLIEGSAIQNAIQHGLQNAQCSAIYSSCKLTAKSLQLFAKKIINK